MHGPPHKGGVSWKLSHNEESLWEIWNAKGGGGEDPVLRESSPSFFFFLCFILFRNVSR